ncbi:MAG: hypothetical protein WC761_00650 [Candidatus Paceibacterota bacterium]|jgi:hypothetical protein
MAIDSKRQVLKQIKERKYLNKDFDALRADILEYARTYFPEQNKDFSEAGLGGMMLDMAAYVGDVQSFYLDHQFQENFADTAAESNNIERHLKKAGVPIVGSAPAVADCTFYIKVPASGTNPPLPDTSALPILHESTVARAQNGTEFELTEDLNFTKTDEDGNLLAEVAVGNRDQNNNPTNFILSLQGVCLSGFRAAESFSVGSFSAFRKFTLSNENVTEIIKVIDGQGNEYYKVDYLTQDTVYKAVNNLTSDNQEVRENMVPIPAPYRFVSETSLDSRLTTLTFGGGSAETINDDIIPDPSEFAIPLYGKKVFSRFTLNPGNLLQTTTFGVLTPNTNVTVIYRYGGGLNHNVEQRTIRNVTNVDITFPNNPAPVVSSFVRNSIDVTNLKKASGGDNPPTTDQLKAKIPAFTAAQGRIVSTPDLLARVYTLPSNFGRVYRASIQTNPNNPLASQLFVICKNAQSQLVTTPDSLKKNLAFYLNQYRMISDAIDILDARIINLKIQFQVVTDPTQNRQLVLRNTLQKLKNYFDVKNFEIDQPLVIADIQNIIYNTPGVVSVVSIDVSSVYGTSGNRSYSTEQFDVPANTFRGILFGPPGSIFEVKFKDVDIIGTAV